jgi:hypothetical protein
MEEISIQETVLKKKECVQHFLAKVLAAIICCFESFGEEIFELGFLKYF